jgi:hypothetical protein
VPRVSRALLIIGTALLLPGCGSSRTVVQTTTVVATPSPVKTGKQWLHGQIRFVRRDGDRYLLGFDPSSFLSGITANVALAQDQHQSCLAASCPPVPNDNYVVDESHRVYTYVLPATARGTVLRTSSDAQTITAAQLASLVAGTSTLKLFEPLESGVWLLVRIDTVQTFAQQYVP